MLRRNMPVSENHRGASSRNDPNIPAPGGILVDRHNPTTPSKSHHQKNLFIPSPPPLPAGVDDSSYGIPAKELLNDYNQKLKKQNLTIASEMATSDCKATRREARQTAKEREPGGLRKNEIRGSKLRVDDLDDISDPDNLLDPPEIIDVIRNPHERDRIANELLVEALATEGKNANNGRGVESKSNVGEEGIITNRPPSLSPDIIDSSPVPGEYTNEYTNDSGQSTNQREDPGQYHLRRELGDSNYGPLNSAHTAASGNKRSIHKYMRGIEGKGPKLRSQS